MFLFACFSCFYVTLSLPAEFSLEISALIDRLIDLYANNRSEDGRLLVVGGSSLRISPVRGYDSALYTCRAFNLEDSIDGDATLTVQGQLGGRRLFRPSCVYSMYYMGVGTGGAEGAAAPPTFGTGEQAIALAPPKV